MNTTAEYFTTEQATDEAMLLLVRKARRTHPAAFAEVWAKLPEGAKRAIQASEMRADVLRDDKALKGIERTWQPVDDGGE